MTAKRRARVLGFSNVSVLPGVLRDHALSARGSAKEGSEAVFELGIIYSRSDSIGQQHAWQPASFHVATVQPATAEQGSGAPVLGLDKVGGPDGLRVARTWRALAREA